MDMESTLEDCFKRRFNIIAIGDRPGFAFCAGCGLLVWFVVEVFGAFPNPQPCMKMLSKRQIESFRRISIQEL
ncbi:MAG: hypothetical protein DKT66_26000 [Candidatus Melainabacteria bacterium]|nr:MAG: hypothetical protein DKT66_26000 [Candidatus Melainabacteria bacterium]